MPLLTEYQPPVNFINILHHNCQSLINKLEYYASLPNLDRYDAILINESWLKEEIPNSLVSLPGFQIYRQDRPVNNLQNKKGGGGSAIYIRSDYEAVILPDLSNAMQCCESVWIKISTKNCTLILATIYASYSNVTKAQFLDELEQVLTLPIFNSTRIILTGDLNINWNEPSQSKNTLIDILTSSNLQQVLTGCSFVSPTTGRESLLDLCFTSYNLKCSYTKMLIADFSDHYAACISLNITKSKKPRNIINYRNFKALSHYLPLDKDSEFIQSLTNIADPNDQANQIEKWMNSFVEKYAPCKQLRVRGDSHQWLSGRLKRLISAKNRFFRKINGIDRSISPNHFNAAWVQYKKFRNFVQHHIRKAKKDYLSSQLSKNIPTFFHEVNRLLGKPRSSASPTEILTEAGLVTNNEQLIAEELNKFFTNVDSPQPNPMPCPPFEQIDAFLFHNVSENQVQCALNRLKSNKRGGELGIPAMIYKLAHETLVPALTLVINNSLEKSIFPDVYKKAVVTPIYKKGDHTCPGNYRPISSLPILSKVFEQILATQIREHIDNNGLLSNRQFGFRTGVSTSHMLHYLADEVSLYLDKKGPKYVALASLDIRKAFDTVNHSALVNKLMHYFSFSNKAANVIKSYLSQRTQVMKIGNTLSSPSPITKGVPQGSILGPLLFNLMVNDMLSTHEFAYSYADDTVILAQSTSQDLALQKLSVQFNLLSNWYQSNGLSLNTAKTKCIVFANSAIDNALTIDLEGCTIPLSENVVLLGVTFDTRLNFNSHVCNIVKKSQPINIPSQEN